VTMDARRSTDRQIMSTRPTVPASELLLQVVEEEHIFSPNTLQHSVSPFNLFVVLAQSVSEVQDPVTTGVQSPKAWQVPPEA
jgi:hypothetical protein